jgi:hypothetical protein
MAYTSSMSCCKTWRSVLLFYLPIKRVTSATVGTTSCRAQQNHRQTWLWAR